MAATAQEMLDAVNDAIKAQLDGGVVKSYSVNGRQLSRYSLDELVRLRNTLKADVAASGTGRNKARFDSPT